MTFPKAVLSPLLFLFSTETNLSQFPDNIAIWAQAPGIRSIDLRLQKYLKQILPWCDRSRIKLNPGETYQINFSQRKVFSDTSITMYGQLVKLTLYQ